MQVQLIFFLDIPSFLFVPASAKMAGGQAEMTAAEMQAVFQREIEMTYNSTTQQYTLATSSIS